MPLFAVITCRCFAVTVSFIDADNIATWLMPLLHGWYADWADDTAALRHADTSLIADVIGHDASFQYCHFAGWLPHYAIAITYTVIAGFAIIIAGWYHIVIIDIVIISHWYFHAFIDAIVSWCHYTLMPLMMIADAIGHCHCHYWYAIIDTSDSFNIFIIFSAWSLLYCTHYFLSHNTPAAIDYQRYFASQRLNVLAAASWFSDDTPLAEPACPPIQPLLADIAEFATLRRAAADSCAGYAIDAASLAAIRCRHTMLGYAILMLLFQILHVITTLITIAFAFSLLTFSLATILATLMPLYCRYTWLGQLPN